MRHRKFITLRVLKLKALQERIEQLESDLRSCRHTRENYAYQLEDAESRLSKYEGGLQPLQVIQERVNTFRQPIVEVVTEVMRQYDYDLQPAALAQCGGGKMKTRQSQLNEQFTVTRATELANDVDFLIEINSIKYKTYQDDIVNDLLEEAA